MDKIPSATDVENITRDLDSEFDRAIDSISIRSEPIIDLPLKGNDIESKSIIEDELVEFMIGAFSDPEGKKFYQKVAKDIPSDRIVELVVTAKDNGRKPAALFNHLVSKEMDNV